MDVPSIEDVKIAVIGNVDSSKCEAAGTKIVMYDKSVKCIEDIVVGDVLLGENDNQVNVLAVTTGYGRLYTVTPSVGRPLIITRNHILCLRNTFGGDIELTLSDYMFLDADSRNRLKLYRTVRGKVQLLDIIAVHYAPDGKYFGFQLDGNQRYIHDDGIVTHNSTIIGTLLRGKNDDGRGSNRQIVMNFPHEKESGMTSSVGYQILGFRDNGSCVNVDNKNKKDSWPKIMQECCKIITFMDLAGHEKYLKTTVYGLSSNRPDYALILIEGRGVRGMTKEHLMLALSFDIPFIIAITKIDLYPQDIIDATFTQVCKLIKSSKKRAWVIHDQDDLIVPLKQPYGQIVPVFMISNVTGQGLPLFKDYLYRLPRRIDYSMYYDKPFEIAVLEGFLVQGIGTVAHGFLSRGQIKAGDTVWVGPDSVGEYHKSKIRSIHYKRLTVDFCMAGHHVCVSLPNIDRKLLKQGVYILHEKVERRAVRKFTASIKVLSNHPITIKRGYCPILNIDNIRMTAKVLDMYETDDTGTDANIDYIRGGKRSKVQFKFVFRPAYLRSDTTFVFREGKTRGYGRVLSIDQEQSAGGVKPKRKTKLIL